MTFSLDEATAARLRRAAVQLRRPKSQIVREAILDFSERIGRMTENERLRKLQAFDELVPRIPSRPAAEVEEELEELRRSRSGGGRLSQSSENR